MSGKKKGFTDNPLTHGLNARGVPNQRAFANKAGEWEPEMKPVTVTFTGDDIKKINPVFRDVMGMDFDSRFHGELADTYSESHKKLKAIEKVASFSGYPFEEEWKKEFGNVFGYADNPAAYMTDEYRVNTRKFLETRDNAALKALKRSVIKNMKSHPDNNVLMTKHIVDIGLIDEILQERGESTDVEGSKDFIKMSETFKKEGAAFASPQVFASAEMKGWEKNKVVEMDEEDIEIFDAKTQKMIRKYMKKGDLYYMFGFLVFEDDKSLRIVGENDSYDKYTIRMRTKNFDKVYDRLDGADGGVYATTEGWK